MKKPSQYILNAALAGILGLTLGATDTLAGGEGKKAETGKCWGATSCKGTADCATDKNTCHGHNTCKGQGWKKMSKAECLKLKKDNPKIKFES